MAILVPGWPQPVSLLSLLKNFDGFNFSKPVGHLHTTKRKKKKKKNDHDQNVSVEPIFA